MKVLVTGAGKGLGRAIALEVAKTHHVTGTVRSVLKNYSERIELIPGINFENPSTFSSIDFTKYDAIVNNVGFAFDGLLALQPETEIRKVIDINLTATLILIKEFVRSRLQVKRPGKIITVSSITAIRGYAGLASYAASKAGLEGATRALARELGPKGFLVNAILPGFMETDMTAALSDAQRKQILKRTPIGRFITVSEVAALADFLISDRASGITGQSFVIDGGITA